MRKVIIVSGANRGLGKALVDLSLQSQNTLVISISRSLHDDHKSFSIDQLAFLKYDLSTPFDLKKIQLINKLIGPYDFIYFFNNAGVIDPINEVGKFSSLDIEVSIRVNIEFPVNFINYSLNTYSNNRIKVINITSGAGNRGIANWSLYCAAKAYMKHFLAVLELENKESTNISFLSVDPGVMNTSMQNKIRNSSFPDIKQFEKLKELNKLIEPKESARKIFDLIYLE